MNTYISIHPWNKGTNLFWLFASEIWFKYITSRQTLANLLYTVLKNELFNYLSFASKSFHSSILPKCLKSQNSSTALTQESWIVAPLSNTKTKCWVFCAPFVPLPNLSSYLPSFLLSFFPFLVLYGFANIIYVLIFSSHWESMSFKYKSHILHFSQSLT